jgi:type IV pilus assembly protein PilQ
VAEENTPVTDAGEAAAPAVTDIRAMEKEGGVLITVMGDRPLNHSLFEMENPTRLALDLPGADMGRFSERIPVNLDPVDYIMPTLAEGSPEEMGSGVSRLEIFLTRPVEFEIGGDDSAIEVLVKEAEVVEEIIEVEEVAESEAVMIEVAESETPAFVEEAPVVAHNPEPEAEMEELQPASRVTSLDVFSSEEGTQVVIQGDGSLEHEYFIVESRSLVVDVFGITNSISPLTRRVADAYIAQVRIGEHFEPRKKVRIVMDLAKLSDYKVVSMDDRILVNFGGLAQMADDTLRDSLANVVTDVYFRPLEDRSILEIATTREPVYRTVDSEDPNRLIVEIDNSRVSPEAQKTLDLTTLNREITQILSFQYSKEGEPVARVVAQFDEMVPYRLDATANRILVEVPRTKVAQVQAEAAEPIMEKDAGLPWSEVAAPPAMEEMAAKGGEAPGDMDEADGPRVYTGRKLSLDFKDADVNDVLRLIADVSGINFVSGPEVKGRITIKLTDVPWDQALDVILKTNTPTLTQIREAENIIRITTVENVLREAEQKRQKEETKIRTVETQKKLEPLVTRSFHISYAKVEEIVPRVENFMSERRQVDAFLEFDTRTNTLIVKDLQANIEAIEKIIEVLDTPTPAVQIEARIVQVTSSFSRSLGIQWGFLYVADAEHGNATGVEWPNSIRIGGTEQGPDVDPASDPFLVNLPISDVTGGVGLSLGHIANTFTLDLRLKAGESLGEVEVLSNPKIFTVQNETAIINVGRQLPVAETDSEGNRSVTWKDVGIILNVTPQVTADGRVFMDVSVERSDKGEDVATTEGLQFSIDTQRAQTKVLLNDGETSVIGGLFQQTTSDLQSGLPWLSDIPGLGWLFKSKTKGDRKEELLIFLTPRIVPSA